MIELGYKLCSEEHGPRELVHFARRAEETGFKFAMISDHFHPWTEAEGQSCFVWGALGGVAVATDKLCVGTGVTCPTMRIHPAIIAQAAATAQEMMPGRFMLGLGSGENLNEHIIGHRWPPSSIRLEMLEEAVEIIKLLWKGDDESYWGDYFTVENARIFTLPDELPPILIASGGAKSAELAGRIGDGLICTKPDKELVAKFRKAGGDKKPVYGEIAVCWADDEDRAVQTAFKQWPIPAMKGEMTQELRTPAHFEQAAQMIDEEEIAEAIVCGPDAERHMEEIQKYVKAGCDHVWVHQIGPDQEGFFQFYKEKIIPKFPLKGIAASK